VAVWRGSSVFRWSFGGGILDSRKFGEFTGDLTTDVICFGLQSCCRPKSTCGFGYPAELFHPVFAVLERQFFSGVQVDYAVV